MYSGHVRKYSGMYKSKCKQTRNEITLIITVTFTFSNYPLDSCYKSVDKTAGELTENTLDADAG